MPTTKTSSRKLSSQERARSFERRLKAASLDDETMPEDMDAFRYALARRIAMFLNRWHGCPEPICQRNRGCMAPNNTCTNIPPSSPEEMEREWPRVKVEIHNALKAHLARHGVVDD
jgi:hypothetical protein